MNASLGLSIIIPVYNERRALEQTLQDFEKILEAPEFDAVELILVDDASDDGSGEFMEEIRHPKVHVHRHPANKGYGAALKSGMRKAGYDYLAITDADGTYPNHKLPEFYRAARDGEWDMVVGGRTGKDVHIPWIRKIPKWFIGKLANYVAGQSIPDINSGLRIMKKAAVTPYLSILPDGFSFTTTITLAMLVNNRPVHYESIDYHKREGRSKIRPIHDTLNFIALIIRTSIFFGPLKVFTAFGLILWIGAILVALAGMTVLEKIPDVTIAILALGGFQIMCLGLVADLINRKFMS